MHVVLIVVAVWVALDIAIVGALFRISGGRRLGAGARSRTDHSSGPLRLVQGSRRSQLHTVDVDSGPARVG